MQLVFVKDGFLCAVSPAWLLLDGRFVRFAWVKMKGYHTREINGETYECIREPGFAVIVRSRSGWARKGKDRYYYYENGKVRKLKRRPMKDLHTREWKVCADDDVLGKRYCFKMTDRGIVLEPQKVRF